MDDASADLILALQMQDLADLAADNDGKEADDRSPNDARIARDIYHEELRNEAAMISDMRFGEKIGEATDDHLPSPIVSPTPLFDQILVKDIGLLTIEASSATEDPAFSSLDHLGTGYLICVVCSDELPARHLITAPCGDHYCKPCIGQLYDLAMTDESLFPPRCCRQPIPVDVATPMLTSTQVQKFLEKSVEFNTPNRIYCHDTTCGAFVGPDNISGEKATCTCGAMTCVVCKAAAHEGDCPEDPAYASLMAFAAGEAYQRCQRCKRLVELSTGCNHITCLCGAQFCYVCGDTWKQCLCPQWDEARLLARAEVMVDRAPAPQFGAPIVHRDQLIQRAAGELEANHDCTHEGYRTWQKVTQGSLTCETCSYTLPNFILECRQCHLRACVRCVHNRL